MQDLGNKKGFLEIKPAFQKNIDLFTCRWQVVSVLVPVVDEQEGR